MDAVGENVGLSVLISAVVPRFVQWLGTTFQRKTWSSILRYRRTIKLLGVPAILDEQGQPCEIRGQQAWAVLARILLSKRPLDRRQLSAELFPETADPLGTLRWCLAALRRALDEPSVFKGDPIPPELPASVAVDIRELETGHSPMEAAGELLHGVDLRANLTFSTWLLVEQQRIAGMIEERIRDACLRALSTGDAGSAVRLAEQGIRRNPFDEGLHVLLVKSLVAAGRTDAALTHVEAAERAFRAELGVAPSAALRSAARRTMIAPAAGISLRSHARSLLEAGKAALSAGAADAGIDTLRRAVYETEGGNATELRAEALLELGTALVHTVRGHDDEGAIVLHEAAVAAEAGGMPHLRAMALRELGYLDALAGRRPSAAAHLASALAVAADSERLAGIHSVIGFNLVDWGRLNEGLEAYRTALEYARSAGNRRREAWCLGIGARGWMEAGNPEIARDWLERCLRIVEDIRWVAFRPWAIALRAEALLLLGRAPGELRRELEDAFALSCQLQDPCWEGASGRAIAHTYVNQGAHTEAERWLEEALVRTCRDANRFAAQHADILEDQAYLLATIGQREGARKRAQDWLSLAARTHMDQSVSRAANFITRELMI